MFTDRAIVIIKVFVDTVVKWSYGAAYMYVGTLAFVAGYSIHYILPEAQVVVQGAASLFFINKLEPTINNKEESAADLVLF